MVNISSIKSILLFESATGIEICTNLFTQGNTKNPHLITWKSIHINEESLN